MTENPDRQQSTDTGIDPRLDDRMRGYADEAEPLVMMRADPQAVRRRAHRRRSRQRAGAAALVSGALLAGGLTWGLLPYTPGRDGTPTTNASVRPDLVSAASLLPPPEPDGRLTADALLPPSSLPWNSTYHWHTLTTDHEPDAPLPEAGGGQCRVRWFDGLTTTEVIARTYAGQREATAQHRIAAFSDPAGASSAASALNSRFRACGWHETRSIETAPSKDGASPRQSTDLHEYVLTSGPGEPVRVTLVQSDNRVAVLAVSTTVAYDHAHPDSRTDACLDKSLRNNNAEPSESPQPTHPSEHC